MHIGCCDFSLQDQRIYVVNLSLKCLLVAVLISGCASSPKPVPASSPDTAPVAASNEEAKAAISGMRRAVAAAAKDMADASYAAEAAVSGARAIVAKGTVANSPEGLNLLRQIEDLKVRLRTTEEMNLREAERYGKEAEMKEAESTERLRLLTLQITAQNDAFSAEIAKNNKLTRELIEKTESLAAMTLKRDSWRDGAFKMLWAVALMAAATVASYLPVTVPIWYRLGIGVMAGSAVFGALFTFFFA